MFLLWTLDSCGDCKVSGRERLCGLLGDGNGDEIGGMSQRDSRKVLGAPWVFTKRQSPQKIEAG